MAIPFMKDAMIFAYTVAVVVVMVVLVSSRLDQPTGKWSACLPNYLLTHSHTHTPNP